jgi:hypothetical protein
VEARDAGIPRIASVRSGVRQKITHGEEGTWGVADILHKIAELESSGGLHPTEEELLNSTYENFVYLVDRPLRILEISIDPLTAKLEMIPVAERGPDTFLARGQAAGWKVRGTVGHVSCIQSKFLQGAIEWDLYSRNAEPVPDFVGMAQEIASRLATGEGSVWAVLRAMLTSSYPTFQASCETQRLSIPVFRGSTPPPPGSASPKSPKTNRRCRASEYPGLCRHRLGPGGKSEGGGNLDGGTGHVRRADWREKSDPG